MADADRANEVMDADEVGVVEPEPEQHRDDEIDSSSDEEDSDEEMEDSDEDSDSDDVDNDDDDSSDEEDVPTPEEVELEYTYPQDFHNRSWQDVVTAGQYFRLILDPSCITIPYEKFLNCRYLIDIVYPEEKDSKLVRIGSLAFAGCNNLQRMNKFPDGLVRFGFRSFYGCSKLQGRITIPPSIQFVLKYCFERCESITSVVFESSTATTTVVELQGDIFRYCKELLSVRLPNNLTIIPYSCFYGCCSLIDVPIPEKVRTIQLCAFTYCALLNTVDLPESVIAIEQLAYSGCSSLARVTIRSSTNAVQVGRGVFEDCPSLATIRVVNPLIWSQLFSAMNTDPSFIYRFVRKYEDQIMMHHRSSR